jgi:outer membrane protein OmpA-like peptidoglycan-associated protein
LIESIQREFRETEEFKAHEEHERITTLYALNKTEFNSKYDFEGTSSKYDECYNVFGNLMNKDKLDKIKADYKARKDYEEKSRSYQENSYSNYNKYSNSGSSSYFNNNQSNHDSEDKETLKQFYRALSKKFHPDANPDKDTSKEMKLLNQLKTEWNI